MKRSILGVAGGLTLLLSASIASGQAPVHLWSKRFGAVYSDVGNAVATDAAGNVFVTGYFRETVNFGGGVLVSAGGSQDIFLAKYNAAGVHQWSKRFGDTNVDGGYAVAVDASGNVFVTGYFSGTVDFGGGDLVSAGSGLGQDIFLARYNQDGVHQWSRNFGGGTNNLGRGIAVDVSGNVFVTGTFRDIVDFGGGNLTSAGSGDIFLAKYSATGAHLWSQRFGDTSFDNGYGVSVDGSGNVFATGAFRGSVDFGGGNFVSAGLNDIYVAKYNAGGVHQWSKRFGNTGDDFAYSVAADGSGSVFESGTFAGTVNFGGDDLVASGPGDAFLAKYDAAGLHKWSRNIGGTGLERGFSVAVNYQNDVFMTGLFQNTVDFGGGPLVSAGISDVFVAKYAATGTHLWSRGFGSAANDYGNGVAVDGSGDVVVTGFFSGTMNCGGNDLLSAGVEDVFVVKYAGNTAEPVIRAVTDVPRDQGRRVRIGFSRSFHDAPGSLTPIVSYEAYRRNDALPLVPLSGAMAAASRRQLLDSGWVYAGEVSAHGSDDYMMDATTDADSTIASGQHYSAFFIRAATAVVTTYFDSPIDSGYSLDNLAPGVPANLVYGAGVLGWKKSTAEDFDYFSVYGANTNSFAAATLVDYCVAPSMDVGASSYVFYFVTATDFSGNEGKPAVINALTGVGGTPKSYVLSISAYPNPFNPSTTIRYTLPSKGRVTLEVFDARGAHVVTLVDEEKAAGAYTREWTGRDDAGQAVSSGVYFARVSHSSGTRSYKMVLLK